VSTGFNKVLAIIHRIINSRAKSYAARNTAGCESTFYKQNPNPDGPHFLCKIFTACLMVILWIGIF
jgi:hypothetical protein